MSLDTWRASFSAKDKAGKIVFRENDLIFFANHTGIHHTMSVLIYEIKPRLLLIQQASTLDSSLPSRFPSPPFPAPLSLTNPNETHSPKTLQTQPQRAPHSTPLHQRQQEKNSQQQQQQPPHPYRAIDTARQTAVSDAVNGRRKACRWVEDGWFVVAVAGECECHHHHHHRHLLLQWLEMGLWLLLLLGLWLWLWLVVKK